MLWKVFRKGLQKVVYRLQKVFHGLQKVFSGTPENFRMIHIYVEVILVMAIKRAEKVCCGKFANCFLVFCGLVGRACNRERLGEGMINSDFLARAFVNIFLMEIIFGKNLRQVELDGKIWMTIDKPDILRRLGSLRGEVGRCLAGKFIFTLESVWLDVGVG